MKRILDEIEKATGTKPIPLKTTKVEKSIIYKYWQVSAYSYRLEIRVIDFTLLSADKTATAIIKAVSNIGDNNLIEGIPAIVLNGGGLLEDYETNTIQRLLYFDVSKK